MIKALGMVKSAMFCPLLILATRKKFSRFLLDIYIRRGLEPEFGLVLALVHYSLLLLYVVEVEVEVIYIYKHPYIHINNYN